MAEADNDKASYIFAQLDDHKLFANGNELAEFLLTLEPWR